LASDQWQFLATSLRFKNLSNRFIEMSDWLWEFYDNYQNILKVKLGFIFDQIIRIDGVKTENDDGF